MVSDILSEHLSIFGVEDGLFALCVIADSIIRQCVSVCFPLEELSEFPECRSATGFLMEQIDTYAPFRLMTAVLAGELVKPPLKAPGKPEVITAEGEDLAAEDSIIKPIREA